MMKTPNHGNLHTPHPHPTTKKLEDWEENWPTKIESGEKEPEFKRKGRTNRKWGRRMGTGRKLSVHISWDVARDILVIKDTTTVHLWLRQWKQNVSGYSHFRIFVKIPKSLLLIVTLP